MVKKAILTSLIVALMAPAAFASSGGLTYHEVQIFNELGRPVTNISSITVRLSGTTNAATIYQDRARTTAITQPITTASTNTTLTQATGRFYWWGPDAWDYTISDGTNTMTNFGHSSFTSSDGRIIFPTYLTAVSSTTYSDVQTATFGGDSDFVLGAGANDNRFTVTTAVSDESAAWWFGADTAGIDVFLYAATTGDYIQWDASDEQLEAVGASILIDDGSLALGDDDAILLGDTLGTGDFSISDISDVLTIDVVVAGTGSIAIGNDADDVPMVWYAETTGAETTFTGDDIQIDGMSLCIGEGDAIQFGDALGTGDMAIACTSNVLAFTQIVADTGTITFGADGTDIPTTWYGETTGDFFRITGDDVQLEDMSLCIAESTQIQFGDALGTGDITLSCASNVLTIGQVASGTGEVYFGVDNKGVDTTFFADTGSDYMKWNQTTEALTFVGANISLDSDSALLNPATAVADATPYALSVNTSGHVQVIPDLTADTTINLPVEASGLHYKFIYGGAAADVQDWIIDTGSDTNYFIGGIVQHDPDAGGDDTVAYFSDGNSNSKIGVLTPEAGTVVEIWCNGTQWYVNGTVISATDTGVTFADQ